MKSTYNEVLNYLLCMKRAFLYKKDIDSSFCVCMINQSKKYLLIVKFITFSKRKKMIYTKTEKSFSIKKTNSYVIFSVKFKYFIKIKTKPYNLQYVLCYKKN